MKRNLTPVQVKKLTKALTGIVVTGQHSYQFNLKTAIKIDQESIEHILKIIQEEA